MSSPRSRPGTMALRKSKRRSCKEWESGLTRMATKIGPRYPRQGASLGVRRTETTTKKRSFCSERPNTFHLEPRTTRGKLPTTWPSRNRESEWCRHLKTYRAQHVRGVRVEMIRLGSCQRQMTQHCNDQMKNLNSKVKPLKRMPSINSQPRS